MFAVLIAFINHDKFLMATSQAEKRKVFVSGCLFHIFHDSIADGLALALALLFIGGALGKFLCGILAEKIGVIPSITITEAVTGLGIFYLCAAPLPALLPFLPLLGIALNGTSSVLYGTVADVVNPSRVPRAFGLFYTVVISAAAITPPLFGIVSDAKGVGFTVVVIASAALLTLPMVYGLHKEMGSHAKLS
jgi:FSR family fosmidomycin resistance protein-like MFS transporter